MDSGDMHSHDPGSLHPGWFLFRQRAQYRAVNMAINNWLQNRHGGTWVIDGAERRQRRRLAPQIHTLRHAEALIHLVRCECGSVARGALSADGRCTTCNAIGRDEQEHGHTLCLRSRPPGFLFRFRARRISRNLDRMIFESANQFEPPLNFEISVRRHYELLVRTALGAGAVPPGTYCQTPQCHLVKRPRLRGLPD